MHYVVYVAKKNVWRVIMKMIKKSLECLEWRYNKYSCMQIGIKLEYASVGCVYLSRYLLQME